MKNVQRINAVKCSKHKQWMTNKTLPYYCSCSHSTHCYPAPASGSSMLPSWLIITDIVHHECLESRLCLSGSPGLPIWKRSLSPIMKISLLKITTYENVDGAGLDCLSWPSMHWEPCASIFHSLSLYIVPDSPTHACSEPSSHPADLNARLKCKSAKDTLGDAAGCRVCYFCMVVYNGNHFKSKIHLSRSFFDWFTGFTEWKKPYLTVPL